MRKLPRTEDKSGRLLIWLQSPPDIAQLTTSQCTKTADPKTCSSCSALGIPCVISHLGDRRRLQSREQFSELQERVHQLEALLVQQARNGGARPSTSPPLVLDPQLGSEDPSAFFSQRADGTIQIRDDLIRWAVQYMFTCSDIDELTLHQPT